MTGVTARLATLGAAMAALAIAAGSASASSTVPCTKISSTHYQCSFYPPGDGLSAGAPVQDAAGHRVGYLNHGANWIICQASGAEVSYEGSRNRWWGYTEANDHHMGWVSAVYASGGVDDGPYSANVPNCGSTYGSPPQTPTSPSPPPQQPPSPPPSPTQVPCSSIGHGRHRCFFYTPGDGIHGGTPVFKGSKRIGYLNGGYNWVLCQQKGAEYGVGNGTVNVWWAYTEANDHRWGWVNAVFGKGGTNNGSFAGVPGCAGRHGNPPGATPPPPPKRPTPPPAPKNMVALGDSYASGEGVSPTYDGKCFRNHAAYGFLVASALGYDLTDFEACGGATTHSVSSYQLGGVSSQTTLITITVGGDEADFVGVLGRCAGLLGVWTSPCHNIIRKESGVIRDDLPGYLDTLYSTIRADAPNAKVVVVGYPHLFGSCATVETLRALRAPTDLLDDTIKAAAARHGFAFVDLRGPFTGHSVCDKDAWVNHLYTHDPYRSFHPTAEGYRRIARLVEGAI